MGGMAVMDKYYSTLQLYDMTLLIIGNILLLS